MKFISGKSITFLTVSFVASRSYIIWLQNYLHGWVRSRAWAEMPFAFSTSFQQRRGENTRKTCSASFTDISFYQTLNRLVLSPFILFFHVLFSRRLNKKFLTQSHCSFLLLRCIIKIHRSKGDCRLCQVWRILLKEHIMIIIVCIMKLRQHMMKSNRHMMMLCAYSEQFWTWEKFFFCSFYWIWNNFKPSLSLLVIAQRKLQIQY